MEPAPRSLRSLANGCQADRVWPEPAELLEMNFSNVSISGNRSVINGVVYNGKALSSELKLRGMPKVQMNVKPTGPRAQVVAYLYDVDALGWGKLITHGVRSLHWATPGQTVSFPIEMDMAAYNVPAGHHLTLVVDTQDARYGKPTSDWFGVDLMFSGDLKSSLTIPYIN